MLGGSLRSAGRQGARLAVLLSGPRASSPADAADRWLIQLRWVALLGMSITIAVAKVLVPGIHLLPLFGVLTGILAVNVAWSLALRRCREQGASHIVAQIAGDTLLLMALLWFSGGLDNPFAVFLTFQIALAGILCSARTTVAVALLSLSSIALLAWAPPLPLHTAPLGRERIELFGRLSSLTLLSSFLGLFVYVYTSRLSELHKESERNEKLAMLGRLVGGMSHEISTPLATIVLASSDLEDLAKDADPEAARLAKTIAGEARRASDIVGLLRGHIRPDQSMETVVLSRFVPEIVNHELDRLGFTGERVFIVPEPVSAIVLRVGLGQVLLNLVTNAVQAMERSNPGRKKRLEVAVLARGPFVEVSVKDNGPGFSAEIVPHLGEPFQTTKEEEGGMGLGLYVSSVLAQRMNAQLRLESMEEGGARVTLTLYRGLARASHPPEEPR